ncbi:hypothetical protein E2562_037140 [Oryza meyeriana var. granulata]|uniref:Uncharacterized protein n=1 Tax=Oryza meyeriana var. granulata TaxID=110450 RepID=A0A6G1CXA7_9ORYZ|nr:hypothetical protein E2562_037140 [Oryza meyeriana var. granulata]
MSVAAVSGVTATGLLERWRQHGSGPTPSLCRSLLLVAGWGRGAWCRCMGMGRTSAAATSSDDATASPLKLGGGDADSATAGQIGDGVQEVETEAATAGMGTKLSAAVG